MAAIMAAANRFVLKSFRMSLPEVAGPNMGVTQPTVTQTGCPTIHLIRIVEAAAA
jgi:hypothetical protein